MQNIKNKFKQMRNAMACKYHSSFKRNQIESVYFYTFHKCASTLFSSYILKNVTGLWSVDFANEIYNGIRSTEKKLNFKKSGVIYGPIRLSAEPDNPIRQVLVEPTISKEFLKDKTSIILIRDPRDIMVSAYYSFGSTHGVSPVEVMAQSQQTTRARINKLTLDEYVLQEVDKQIEYFGMIKNLSENSGKSVVLRYEDMINDFDVFVKQLCKHLNLSQVIIDETRRRSRPKENEDKESHQRSGKPGGFKTKLKKQTVIALNDKLKDTLETFGYDQ